VRLVGGLLFGGPTGLIGAGLNQRHPIPYRPRLGGELIAAVTGRPMVTAGSGNRLADYKARHGTMVAAGSTPPATALIAANTISAAPVAASLQPPAKGSIGAPPVPGFPGGAMPSGLAADATGLSGKAGLPSAGSITPAALMTPARPAAGGRRAAARP